MTALNKACAGCARFAPSTDAFIAAGYCVAQPGRLTFPMSRACAAHQPIPASEKTPNGNTDRTN